MKKLIVFILLIMILIIPSTSCNYQASYPVYEKPSIDESIGRVLDIDGVIYRTLPKTDWSPDFDSKKTKIGQIDYSKTNHEIYAFESDIDRIFIYTGQERVFGTARIEYLYYRKDIDFPDFCASNIDGISFKGNNVTNKQVIEEVFSLFENAEEQSVSGRPLVGLLYFTNLKYKGIHVPLAIYANNDKYWLRVGDSNSRRYTEISKEILEELAGKELSKDIPVYDDLRGDRP